MKSKKNVQIEKFKQEIKQKRFRTFQSPQFQAGDAAFRFQLQAFKQSERVNGIEINEIRIPKRGIFLFPFLSLRCCDAGLQGEWMRPSVARVVFLITPAATIRFCLAN